MGILSGTFGIGGGVVSVPILNWVFIHMSKIPRVSVMHFAIGTSLCVIFFTSISSFYAHLRRKGIDFKTFYMLGSGLVIGSIIGVLLADELTSSQLRYIFVIFTLLIAIYMFRKHKISPKDQKPYKATLLTIALPGILIGGLSTLLGIGGGAFNFPLLSWRGLSTAKAIGTAAACTLPTSIIGMIGYGFIGMDEPPVRYSLGFIYLPAAIAITIPSVIFPFIGARLAHSLPVHVLKKVFAVLIALIAISMLFVR